MIKLLKTHRTFFICLGIITQLMQGCKKDVTNPDNHNGGTQSEMGREIWPVQITFNKYPALGDTVEIETSYRFIRKEDNNPDAVMFRKYLEDTIFAQRESVYVSGKFNFYPHLNFQEASTALQYVSGSKTFGSWMKITDSATFRAKYKAVKKDTIMIESLLKISNFGPSGFKVECLVIQDSIGIGLGDCWESN